MSPETPIRPHYDDPPLIEQAISVCFEPPANFSIVDYGLFWDLVKEDFPIAQTAKRLETPVEIFEGLRPDGIGFNLLTEAPMPRALFRGQDGEVLYLQDDRFGYNWAKIGDTEYPRSETVMKNFEKNFRRLSDYFQTRGIEPLTFKQCELTNLNLLKVESFGDDFEDITEALKVDPLDLGIPFLPPETLVRNRQHRIINAEGTPIGRLHISIAPVIANSDGSKAFRFELTARSAQNIDTLESARGFFQIARNAINGAFQSLVTDKMKAIWGERT